jgi:N utilization substance protein A
LPAEEEQVARVSLAELKGLSPELVAVLEQAGKKTLQDVFDLERDEVLAIPGITPELADKLMAFLTEMTEEGEEDAEPEAPAPSA